MVEERFTRDEMYIADEVFVTGTAAELTPVTKSIDGASETVDLDRSPRPSRRHLFKLSAGKIPLTGWLTPI